MSYVINFSLIKDDYVKLPINTYMCVYLCLCIYVYESRPWLGRQREEEKSRQYERPSKIR